MLSLESAIEMRELYNSGLYCYTLPPLYAAGHQLPVSATCQLSLVSFLLLLADAFVSDPIRDSAVARLLVLPCKDDLHLNPIRPSAASGADQY